MNVMGLGRIVHGSETNEHKYPWLAAMLTTRKNHVCGGTLIG